jgi:O-antigen/teichoic acid export membrane protein
MEDSLFKRYSAKVFASGTSILTFVGNQSLAARGLGTKAYGDFTFLTGFFTEIVSFLDMGTSIGFFSKLSQRQNDKALVGFYLWFTLIIASVLFVGIAIVNYVKLNNKIWPDQAVFYLFIAALWGILNWETQIFSKISDARGLTVHSERMKMAVNVISFLTIVVIFKFAFLNLNIYFAYSCLFLLIAIGANAFIIKIKGNGPIAKWGIASSQTKGYSKELFAYSSPLIVYSVFSLLSGIADKWLLQTFGGSAQQAFFGLSSKIASTYFVFVVAMTPLIIREFSIAFGENSRLRMAEIYRRYIPLFYSLSAFFSCFIALQAEKVIHFFGGAQFHQALIPMTIMAFYPIHQTYGQLSSAVFLSSNQTRMYRNLGIIFSIVGLATTFFMLAPSKLHGLNLGAMGLSIKMVLVQFLAVNVQLIIISKYLKLSFTKYFLHQICVLIFLLTIGKLATGLTNMIFFLTKNEIVQFCANGFLYTMFTIIFLFRYPKLFGIVEQDVPKYILKMSRYLPRSITEALKMLAGKKYFSLRED